MEFSECYKSPKAYHTKWCNKDLKAFKKGKVSLAPSELENYKFWLSKGRDIHPMVSHYEKNTMQFSMKMVLVITS